MRITQKFLTWARSVEPGLNVFLGDPWDDEDMWVAHTDPGWVCQQAFDDAIKCWERFHVGAMLVVSLSDKVSEKVVQKVLIGLVLVCVINLCHWAIFGGRK